MPTLNPRTNVTLPPSLDLLLVRLAAMQKTSKSQVLRELLEAAEPALQRAVTLMEAASKASEQVRDGLRDSLNRAQDHAEAVLSEQMSFMDAMSGDLVTMAESVRRRRPAGARKAVAVAPRKRAEAGKAGVAVESTPVLVTRGSGPGKTRRKV